MLRLFVDFAPMSNSRHIDGSSSIINLIHNSVVTYPNTPLFVAALELLAA